MKRKFLAGLLALSMLLGLLPASALAVEGEGGDGLSVKAETLFPTAEEENKITITGGSGTQTVRISGYRAPWYVTDGLVLHYDGIYNQGVGEEHDSNTTTWKDLSSTGADLTIPSTFSGTSEGWTDNGLYLKDTVISKKSFSVMEMTQGFTWDYAFDFNDEDFENWNMSENPTYQFPVQLVSNNVSLGRVNNSTRVLSYSGVMDEEGNTTTGSHNWPPYLTPFTGNDFILL